jgi:hypothetical protein
MPSRDTVSLDLPGILQQLAERGVELADGLQLNVWDEDVSDTGERDDLIAVGQVERDEESKHWVLRITAWGRQSEGRL